MTQIGRKIRRFRGNDGKGGKPQILVVLCL